MFSQSASKIGIVKIEGVIGDGDSFGAGLSKVIASLKEAERRKARAVVLRVNSPGGTVAACQEILSSVERLKKKRGIPVVASMGDVAASGGIYVCMAADEIVANPGTVTGSIGVIIKSSDLSHLYNKLGISPKVIKSGPYKDMLSTYRSFSSDEQSLLQNVIDDTHWQFVDRVAKSRKKSRSEIEQVADGRILTGRQAMDVGLVDHLGDLGVAIERATSLAGIQKEAKLFVVKPRKSVWQRLLSPFLLLLSRSAAAELKGVPLWLLPTGDC